MNIAIIEDNIIHCGFIKTYIEKWSLFNDIKCRISTYLDTVNFLDKYEEKAKLPFDLLFVDIRMPSLSGMDMAKRIRSWDSKVKIVFVTGETECVFDGYKVSALDYIVKPVMEEDIFSALDRTNYLLKESEKFLLIENSLEIVKINLRDIIFVEVRDKMVCIRVKDLSENDKYKDILVRSTLEKIINQIEASGGNFFSMPHRSFYCNLQLIKKVSKQEVHFGIYGTVPVSRGKKEDFIKDYFDYLRKNQGV